MILYHGLLSKEVYIKQQPDFVHLNKFHYVCHLKEAIYRLKQAPSAWFHYFSCFLLFNNFVCSMVDPSMFVYGNSSLTSILLLCVNDIILTGSTASALQSFIVILSQQFVMKDLRDLYYFLRC